MKKELEGPRRILEFSRPINQELERLGHVPLPPYIHKKLQNSERYQTIFAKEPGSSAAPTAGLHFTPQLVRNLIQRGVKFAEINLQIGLDTFAPVNEDDPHEHRIHSENCSISEETAGMINNTRKRGGRIVAVGTTSARCLESAKNNDRGGDLVVPYSGPTDLFILPGYQFKIVDALITNFHLPKSTLIMMVSAFAGRERILNAYDIAIREGYRFYSFGDAMLIK